MTDDNVFKLAQPGTFSDSLTEILRNGARNLLVQAVEAEVADWLGHHRDLTTNDGRRRLVRHGHLPEREIMTASRPKAKMLPPPPEPGHLQLSALAPRLAERVVTLGTCRKQR